MGFVFRASLSLGFEQTQGQGYGMFRARFMDNVKGSGTGISGEGYD